jgi:hypothetical protein
VPGLIRSASDLLSDFDKRENNVKPLEMFCRCKQKVTVTVSSAAATMERVTIPDQNEVESDSSRIGERQVPISDLAISDLNKCKPTFHHSRARHPFSLPMHLQSLIRDDFPILNFFLVGEIMQSAMNHRNILEMDI